MKYFLLFFLFLIPLNVNAYTVEYTLYNYKTLQPIESVNVSIYNSTYYTSKLTDINGYVLFDVNGSFNVAMFRSMYAEYDTVINITNNTASDIMMMPYSHSGIVKVTMADMTVLGGHISCFYFDNNRQEGCYNSSQTEIILHNNMVYYWQPIISKNDLIANPVNSTKYFYLYYGTILGLLFISLILAFVLAIIYHIIFKKK